MLTLHSALRQGTQLLEEAAIPVPRLTAEVLLCHAAGCEREYLYAHPEEPLTQNTWIHYGRYLHERLLGKPTQYITQKQEFYGRAFHVTRDVLIPRPETEHLVEAAAARSKPGDIVLDVGTGSGAIAITLALETKSRVLACDISIAALRVAKDNGCRLNARVEWFAGDLASAVRAGSLDMLISNPPYVPSGDAAGLQREIRDWEPPLALFGGPAGIEFYGRLIEHARAVLRPGGYVLFELGYNSLELVQAMLGPEWSEIEVVHDLAGFPRVLAFRYMRPVL